MGIKGISLDWLLPGTVLVLGVLAGVALTLRGRRAAQAEAGDSWERGEARRRRREAAFGSLSYLLLFCCAAVAAALSFHGLVGFGQENLNLSDGWEYLVPFGLDGAAMFCSVIAVREASNGDAALGSRLLVWTFAGAAAWFNWVHAPRGLDHAGAPQFFAGMSLSAAVLFDQALKQTRRAALREQGLVPRPLPQIRMVRWLRAPRETFRAWSLMLLEGVRSLDEAVEEVRQDRREKERGRSERREQVRLERLRARALHRGWGQDAHHAEVTTVTQAPAPQPSAPQPAAAEPPQLPAPAARPAVEAQAREQRPRADEESLAAPRLDTLEQKLTAMERQFR